MRPVIFLVLVVLMFFTWILFGENFKVNIELLGVIATSLAFFATAWAAHEARKSAKAALNAVKTADETLTEAKKNYQRDIFEKRYSLLLEQHNNQLQNVYSYLSSGSEDSKTLTQKISNNQFVSHAVSYLNGHSIISPYMRTLYHLLKHIDQNFYIDDLGDDELIKKKKEYSSPLRSIIRNDVLYLIGINSLIRKRIENNVEVDNGYGYYQDMLNKFSFFEHAIFFDWSDNIQYENVRQKMEDYLENRYTSRIRNSFLQSFRSDGTPSISIVTYPKGLPVILGLGGIYLNPTHSIVNSYLDNVESIVSEFLEEEFSNARLYRSNILKKILLTKGNYIGINDWSKDLDPNPVTGSEIVNMIFTYGVSGEMKIRGSRPLFFSQLKKHSGTNSFGSESQFASDVENDIRNYLLYSRMIKVSEGEQRVTFFNNFLEKAKTFVFEDKIKLIELKPTVRK